MTSAAERFNELFGRTHGAVLAYAVRRCTDPADAADVVAETFLVAWRRLDRVPADAERAWLFGVARRVLANQRRGRQRQHAMAERLRHELAVASSSSAEPAQPSPLSEAIERLPETDRELLRLLAWEDLSQEEAAVALGISAGALRVRLHRTRRRLQAMLGDREGIDGLDAATSLEGGR